MNRAAVLKKEWVPAFLHQSLIDPDHFFCKGHDPDEFISINVW